MLSTHQMNHVEALCDRVALINRGRLMVYGAVDEVRRRHSLPEVRVHAHGPLPAIAADAGAVQGADGEWRITLRLAASRLTLLRSLVGAGTQVRPFRAAARADGRHLSPRRQAGRA